jgi:hypothetical protein
MPTIEAAVDQAKLRERILASTATVIDWASSRVWVDRKAELAVIQDFYDDYSAWWRDRKSVGLPRKGWLWGMKLCGFRTESGEFVGIRLKSGE